MSSLSLIIFDNFTPIGGILGNVCADDKEVENLVTSGAHLDLIMMTVLFEEKMAYVVI